MREIATITLNLALYPAENSHELWSNLDKYLIQSYQTVNPKKPQNDNFKLLSLIGLMIRSSYTMEEPYIQSEENKLIANYESSIVKNIKVHMANLNKIEDFDFQ